ncbi:uncharacterized protein JCM10292_000831 [Rhodotorula paludigena]|uniref:uncharacterized protein n=1 Tax=Rhodotorula paludigena TaxID=86838 RepID=UPI00316FEF7D
MLSHLVAVSALAGAALAQNTPLAAKRFTWDNLPYKADAGSGERGPQVGVNQCNSTMQNQESMCQTAHINSIDDFCLWGPPEYGEEVGNIEGEMVAWCTKEGYGTRIIPEGALTGVQFIRTPHYVQVVGFINQQLINILPEDYGGEMDPHGADQRGNPLGGLVFSTEFDTNATSISGVAGGQAFSQVIQWHNFMGANQFCLKACDPSWENGWQMCEHIYDRIGCNYNAPSNWATINGTFESCMGDDQLPPGQYVENGVTSTYTQPPESLGIISTIPYQPFTPSSSSCTPYTSSAIYTAASQQASGSATSAAESSSTTSGASSASETGSTSAGSASGSNSRGSSGAPAATGTPGSQQNSQDGGSGAEGLKVAAGLTAVVAGLIGVVAAL